VGNIEERLIKIKSSLADLIDSSLVSSRKLSKKQGFVFWAS
jgi:hypothetical protein